MRNILCYGDSNTWGYTPGTGVRYAPGIRWTGVLQRELGSEYRVLEDGLNARTTAYDDPCTLWRNGADTLPPALIAQKPLDLLILSLGTNDLKFTDAFGAARGCEFLIDLAHMVQAKAESSPVFPEKVRILIISPIALGKQISEDPYSTLRKGYQESLRFPEMFARAAQRKGAHFLDAQKYAQPSPVDQVHMSPESHERLGKAVAEKVREIFLS